MQEKEVIVCPSCRTIAPPIMFEAGRGIKGTRAVCIQQLSGFWNSIWGRKCGFIGKIKAPTFVKDYWWRVRLLVPDKANE